MDTAASRMVVPVCVEAEVTMVSHAMVPNPLLTDTKVNGFIQIAVCPSLVCKKSQTQKTKQNKTIRIPLCIIHLYSDSQQS